MCEKFAVESKVIPITDNTIETRITANGEDLHLQEFWVKHRGRGTIAPMTAIIAAIFFICKLFLYNDLNKI